MFNTTRMVSTKQKHKYSKIYSTLTQRKSMITRVTPVSSIGYVSLVSAKHLRALPSESRIVFKFSSFKVTIAIACALFILPWNQSFFVSDGSTVGAIVPDLTTCHMGT